MFPEQFPTPSSDLDASVRLQGKGVLPIFFFLVGLILIGLEGINHSTYASDGIRGSMEKALYQGDTETVKKILGQEVNPDISLDRWNNTPLIIASRQGFSTLVELLLRNGASVNKYNRQGVNPIIVASSSGHVSIVRTLLSYGADPDAPVDYSSDTMALYLKAKPPLIGAALNGHREVVESLLEAGANTELTDEGGATAIIRASCQGHRSIVERLIEAGSSVNHQDNQGWSSLMCASYDGHAGVLRTLLQSEADIKLRNDKGATALHEAFKKDEDTEALNIVKILLKNNSDPNAKDENGNTPLHFAIKEEYVPSARLLLREGAKPLVENNQNVRPWDLMVHYEHTRILHATLENSLRIDQIEHEVRRFIFLLASKKGDRPLVEKFLKHGVDPNFRMGNEGETPLTAALRGEHLGVAKRLRDHGARLDFPNRRGVTPRNLLADLPISENYLK
jgi:ankyrin repeat protein